MARSCKSKVCNPALWPSGSTEGVSPEIIEECKELVMTNDHLQTYMQLFRENINRGLGKATNPNAIVKCFPTYVQDLPDGTEKGKFLALDLGGSNIRVLMVDLGDPDPVHTKVYTIPKDIMQGTGEQLFDFIADCLVTFIKSQGLAEAPLPLGFTFSFPLVQKGLKVGILERWTKDFTCSGVIGNNVVEMLQTALQKHGDIKVDVSAVLNDTTGTLVAAAFKNPLARIGLIVGTGTNGCYVEKQENAELFNEPDLGSGKVIINLEWGAFGDDGALDFVRVSYDEDVDANSVNPGKQKHEKMISGMYMGELVRLALEKFTKAGLMFEGLGSDALYTRHTLESSAVSDIERDRMGDYSKVKKICDSLGLTHATLQDHTNVRYVASCITRRAAHLVSAGLVVLMERVGEKQIAVGIDGTVYKFHPHFHNLMVEKIKELVGDTYDFELLLVEDGSGIGAALVAAVTAKKR
ncbi:hexokinase type 2-like [Anoplophora glabripennis]|uniref:hexokinase type 2-like n=1 Tax=Anoplophora glabripennis TaxID=217634 RepID=UPI000874DF06|nr:hexokinase type 2-like [Anoplophora glabripennis]